MDDSYLIEQTPFCPTCGRRNPLKVSPEWLLSKFSGIVGNVLAILIEARAHRKAVSKEEILECMRNSRRKNKRVNPGIFPATLSQMNSRLRRHGWVIVGPKQTGTGYYLVPFEEED